MFNAIFGSFIGCGLAIGAAIAVAHWHEKYVTRKAQQEPVGKKAS